MSNTAQDKKPVISIIASAARPENWPGLYESLGSNDIEFEMVMVGPNAPKQELPANINYIKSNVKPAQCVEIAARYAKGDILLLVADDCVFATESVLDRMYETYLASKNPKVMISCRYTNGNDESHRFFPDDPNSTLLPMYVMLSKQVWRDVGGIDRRFIAVSWDIDIFMRIMAAGGEVVLSEVYVDGDMEEDHGPRSRGSKLVRDHKLTDRALVDSLWSTNGVNHFNRALPFEPLSDVDILVKSQHPQGRWKYQSGLINKFITTRFFYWAQTQKIILFGRFARFRVTRIPYYVSKALGR